MSLFMNSSHAEYYASIEKKPIKRKPSITKNKRATCPKCNTSGIHKLRDPELKNNLVECVFCGNVFNKSEGVCSAVSVV
jgi:Zn ribbon nucleic-acid-binding protein